MEEVVGAHPGTIFVAKQILDLFLKAQEELSPESYQLAAATAMRISLKVTDPLTQSVQSLELPLETLVPSGGPVEASQLHAQMLAAVGPQLAQLHSPYDYCSDELLASLLPSKFLDVLPLMVAYVSTHPASFGVSALSILLAVLRFVGGPAVPLAGFAMAPTLLADSDRMAAVLEEIGAAPDLA